MSDRNKIELKRVLAGISPHACNYVVGGTSGVSAGCSRIYICDDGHGLSGYFDNIHVIFDDGRHLVMPAHHCMEWELNK